MKGAFIIREVKDGYSLNYRMPDGELIFKPSVFPDYETVTEMANYMATRDNREQWALYCRTCTNDFSIVLRNDKSQPLLEGKDEYTKRKAWDRVEAMCASFADAETIVLKRGERMPRRSKTS
jgi:hypothetical protein